MRLNLTDKVGYEVYAKNQLIGTVVDFGIDKKKWKLRYIQVSLQDETNEKSILLPVSFLTKIQWRKKKFHVDNDKFSMEKLSVNLKELDKKSEKVIHNELNLEGYWQSTYVKSMDNLTKYAPKKVLFIDTEYSSRIPEKTISNSEGRIVSFKSLLSTKISIGDSNESICSDLIFNSKKWAVKSMVIKNRDPKLLAKRILPLKFIEKLDIAKKTAIVNSKHDFKKLGLFYQNDSVNTKLVEKSFDFTGNPITA